MIELAEVATTVAVAVVALAGVVAGVTLLLVVVNLAKEKFGMALVGLLFPPVAATGAVRLAKPHSLWTRLYGDEKAARAEARYGGESAPA